MTAMFHGFETFEFPVDGACLRGRIGGSGPPLLLLHGFPQTHVHWHRLAPLLKDRFTLVMPDLPGYGDSTGRPPDAAHSAYCKRVMASDVRRLMLHFHYERFHVAGHDRGARVAYRLALDHADSILTLTSFDTVPTLEIWEAMDWKAAIDAFHWPLLAQPYPVPETFISSDPLFFLNHLVRSWVGAAGTLDEAAMSAYAKALSWPSVVRAMCEDYRAGATIDVDHDRADLDRRHSITCPLLVLRGTEYQPRPLLPSWRRWAGDVRETGLACGHFIAEEAPQETAEILCDFLEKR